VRISVEVRRLPCDRPGSFVQRYLQELSRHIFVRHAVAPALKSFVDEAWQRLPLPTDIPTNALPDRAALNYFVPSEPLYRARQRALESVVKGLTLLEHGGPAEKIFSARYTSGLPGVPLNVRTPLRMKLESYVVALESAAKRDAKSP
jgi:hypothetical protein